MVACLPRLIPAENVFGEGYISTVIIGWCFCHKTMAKLSRKLSDKFTRIECHLELDGQHFPICLSSSKTLPHPPLFSSAVQS